MVTRFSILYGLTLIIALVLIGCLPGPRSNAEAGTPLPTLAQEQGPTALKFRLMERFPLFFCDPDEYPVSRGDELDKAREIIPELETDSEVFETILAHTGLTGDSGFSDEEKLLIYRAYKRLAAVQLEPAGGDSYTFQLQSAEAEGSGETFSGEIISGVIDTRGDIRVTEREPTIATCPICLAAGTRIETPNGPAAVEELREGDRVWTLSRDGRRTAVRLLRVGRTQVPQGHLVVHLVLSDGREARLSPGHPTADGRLVGELRRGDWLDGARVHSSERFGYTDAFTYDILPEGATGFYWANGILIGSTYPVDR